VPLAHSLSFAPGQGWVDWLPQYGLGAVGGWFAALIYIFFLGLMLFCAGDRALGSESRCPSADEPKDACTLSYALACLGGAVLSGGSFAGGSIAAGTIGAVPAGITQLIASERLPSSAVSFVVLDAESGRMVMSHNPDTPRSPASTIKTVTTFAALDMLGPPSSGRPARGLTMAICFCRVAAILTSRWNGGGASCRVKGCGLEIDPRRYRHRQHRIFPAQGGFRAPSMAGRIARTTCCPTA